MIKIDKITLQNFRFFADDTQNNTFETEGKNVLIYGENGSGKSSLFKAFEFLSTPSISATKFNEQKNIFKVGDETYLEFEFSNNETLRIDDDHLSLEGGYDFVEKLSIPRPLLDYKSLLKITYDQQLQSATATEKNLYSFFEQILEDYPIEEDKALKDIRGEGEAYFAKYRQIIKNELLDEINILLKKFKHDFKITDIKFDGFNKTVFLKIDYFEQDVGKYHLFLNEARLSALAISVYFAIIKKQFGYLTDDSLKILILDDLLISLDMNNRLSLIDILKSEFSDYQIFFFTHDKELFEVFKDKMDWRAFEIYVDMYEDGYEVPFLKSSNSLLEQAKLQKLNKNYDCSANLLRQCTEKLMCKYLPPQKLVDRNCRKLDLNGLLQNAIAFEKEKGADGNTAFIDGLTRLQTYRKIILNTGSHYDDTNIYKRELKEAIDEIEELERIVDNIPRATNATNSI